PRSPPPPRLYPRSLHDALPIYWACETGGVNALYRRGWRKEDLVTGVQVTIDGWQARNGTSTMNASSILMPDGKRLFAGSSASTADRKSTRLNSSHVSISYAVFC